MTWTGTRVWLASCVVMACGLGASVRAQTARVSVDAGTPGIAVSPNLYGIFFEEINRAGDGGLYAEMIQNRSFEDVAAAPTAWELVGGSGVSVSWSLDKSLPLNGQNPTSLRVDVKAVPAGGRAGIANLGFVGAPRNGNESDQKYIERFNKAVSDQRGQKHGLAVKAGAEYQGSVYIRNDSASPAQFTVTLETGDGTVLASASIRGVSHAWKQYPVFLKATADATDAKLVIATNQPGSYFFDMVSLFPKETFMGRANGMRKDLAEKVKAMKPAFMRFPGGCFVEGEFLANRVKWKETIGDVAERPGRYNLWGYRSTDGLGMFEYLQFCEDVGAEPLFVINCGMAHKDHVAMADMAPVVQDALDGIEYCNGPVTSTWGAKRAAAGHPEPFHLKYLEVGNENGGKLYHERFALIVNAIRAKYPDVQIIACDWGGVPKDTKFEYKDEHYYNTPSWFLAHADQYDRYPRTGPKVYVGEYAVTQGCGLGNLAAAVGEAAFMIGMERNSDVVQMASYAPLLAEPVWKHWNPNAINFDGARVYGTPSYYVQTMFANNRPEVIVPAKVEQLKMPQPTPHGRIGIGTWNTQAEYKDIEVSAPDGTVLWRADPAKGMKQFAIAGGQWEMADGAFRQVNATKPAKAFAGDETWGDCTIKLKARKIAGDEGFLVSFHSTDPTVTSWWNIGGWGNKQHGIETPEIRLTQVKGAIETGRWYDIRIDLRGALVSCYLDGQKVQEATAVSNDRVFVGAGRVANDVVIKAVNAANVAVATTFDLKGVAEVSATGRAVVLTSGDMKDENSLENPTKVAPREETFAAAREFQYTLPARSVVVLRVETAQK